MADNTMKVVLERFGWLALVTWFLIMLAANFQSGSTDQQFAYLARSMVGGRADINSYPYQRLDSAYWKGNYYWPPGGFPALILVPLEKLAMKWGLIFPQSYLQPILVIVTGILLYSWGRKMGYSKGDSRWWMMAFLMGSVYSAVAMLGRSWQFAQVVTVGLMITALLEFFGRRNYWVVGLLMGCVWLTRPTAGLGIVFFAWEAVRQKRGAKDLARLLIPFIGCAAIGIGYNFLRFGNWWQMGYGIQLLPEALNQARSYGVFSLKHIPGNIYYFLLAGPLPVYADGLSRVMASPYLVADPWGLSVGWTSPYILKIFSLKNIEARAWRMLVVSGAVAAIIFVYYGLGVRQVGYRYALDFWPFLHWVVMSQQKIKRLSWKYKLLILLSTVANFYWFKTMFVS